MDYTTLGTFIQQLGFPVAVCVALFWYLVKTEAGHKEEIQKLSDAVNNNTLVMQKLLDRITLGGKQNGD